MSTSYGTISDKDDEKIEIEIYTSSCITLMIYDHNNLDEPSSFKIRLDEEGFDSFLEKLIIAGKQQGYNSNWLK